MKRFIQASGLLYVCFAIFAAYSSIPSDLSPCQGNVGTRINVKESEPNVYSSSSLDRFNSYFRRGNKYEEYAITIWTSPTCVPCKKYLREEVPTLLRAGFVVYIFDSELFPPPQYVNSFPTVAISKDNELLSVESYWKAKDIKKFVDSRTGLKGDGKEETYCIDEREI